MSSATREKQIAEAADELGDAICDYIRNTYYADVKEEFFEYHICESATKKGDGWVPGSGSPFRVLFSDAVKNQCSKWVNIEKTTHRHDFKDLFQDIDNDLIFANVGSVLEDILFEKNNILIWIVWCNLIDLKFQKKLPAKAKNPLIAKKYQRAAKSLKYEIWSKVLAHKRHIAQSHPAENIFKEVIMLKRKLDTENDPKKSQKVFDSIK